MAQTLEETRDRIEIKILRLRYRLFTLTLFIPIVVMCVMKPKTNMALLFYGGQTLLAMFYAGIVIITIHRYRQLAKKYYATIPWF